MFNRCLSLMCLLWITLIFAEEHGHTTLLSVSTSITAVIYLCLKYQQTECLKFYLNILFSIKNSVQALEEK